MDQLVAHPGYSTPRDVRVLRAKIRREVLHCLADDTKASLNCVLDQFVVEEGILVEACDVPGDGVDTLDHMRKANPRILRHRIGISSPKTRSLRRG